MQPLTVQVYRERIVAWQYLALYDVFTVTPNTDHNLQSVKTCLWLLLSLLILVKPRAVNREITTSCTAPQRSPQTRRYHAEVHGKSDMAK
ncbi:hypothetical protein Y032_0053g2342 [Ancylostoma ceylanicum]|uniref:Uncharacterized protein n=1 Tax=Ancylostoma ceylanicum TaxID=53326 RepID=A0A016U6R3_9BILA|nr:hypothetical protein Y032_0053g2342 [Ancylostoma ceylanicum]